MVCSSGWSKPVWNLLATIRVRLVDDHREALARQLADAFGDHRELLDGGDDDGLAGLERFLELARGGVDVLHDAEGLLELAHGALQLAVEHFAVGDDDDRVEHPPVAGVVQGRQPVRQPGDGEALAAAGRVLDQVALAGTGEARVGDQAAHAGQASGPPRSSAHSIAASKAGSEISGLMAAAPSVGWRRSAHRAGRGRRRRDRCGCASPHRQG
jgi:uncharacterized Zn-binding protein involved in type VI secretion